MDFPGRMWLPDTSISGRRCTSSGTGKLELDFVGRFETLEDDFRCVSERIGLAATLGIPQPHAWPSGGILSRLLHAPRWWLGFTRKMFASWATSLDNFFPAFPPHFTVILRSTGRAPQFDLTKNGKMGRLCIRQSPPSGLDHTVAQNASSGPS